MTITQQVTLTWRLCRTIRLVRQLNIWCLLENAPLSCVSSSPRLLPMRFVTVGCRCHMRICAQGYLRMRLLLLLAAASGPGRTSFVATAAAAPS
jgi:hypothetical protein